MFTSSGLKIYTIDGDSLTTLYTSTSITSSNKFQLGDFNGDGKMDLFVYGTASADWTIWRIYHSTGTGLDTKFIGAKKTNLKNDNIFARDYNGDGRTDILALSANSSNQPQQYYFIVNPNGDNFYTEIGNESKLNKAWSFRMCDYDGDNKTDLVVMNNAQYWISKTNANSDLLLSSIGDGLGNTTQITYQKLSADDAIYQKGVENDNFPVFTYRGPLNVVSTVQQNNDENHSYTYEGLKMHRLGKGWLSFTKMTDNESISGNTIENQYSYDSGWFYPKLLSATTSHAGNNISVVSNTYNHIEYSTSPGTKRVFPYIQTTSETECTDRADGYLLFQL